MTNESPLFVSAMELLAHSAELYSQKNSRKLKFIILHLANAVELIFKACLIEKGSSIYDPKNPKATLSVWETVKECERLGIAIPEKAKLELLIDDRNQIQHRFGSPDPKTVDFYMRLVVDFMKRFLRDAFGLGLDETMEPHLTKDLMALIGLVDDEFQHLTRLAQVSPEGAVLQAFSDIEKILESHIRPLIGGIKFAPYQISDFAVFLENLADKRYIPHGFRDQFAALRSFRNAAAHGKKGQTQAGEDLAIARTLLSGLNRAIHDGTITTLWPTDFGITAV